MPNFEGSIGTMHDERWAPAERCPTTIVIWAYTDTVDVRRPLDVASATRCRKVLWPMQEDDMGHVEGAR